MTYRILFTGWREMKDEDIVQIALGCLPLEAGWAFKRPTVFVHGAARGLDSIADRLAPLYGATAEPHPANWAAFGKAAGRARNEQMVAYGADICLAFPGPGSIGTWHCVRKAADAGIPVRIYPVKG